MSYRTTLKAQGRCPHCARPWPGTPTKTCRVCLDRRRALRKDGFDVFASAKARYWAKRAQHICQTCPNITPVTAYCPDCRAAQRLRHRQYYWRRKAQA